jgi:hypothetical protein
LVAAKSGTVAAKTDKVPMSEKSHSDRHGDYDEPQPDTETVGRRAAVVGLKGHTLRAEVGAGQDRGRRRGMLRCRLVRASGADCGNTHQNKGDRHRK